MSIKRQSPAVLTSCGKGFFGYLARDGESTSGRHAGSADGHDRCYIDFFIQQMTGHYTDDAAEENKPICLRVPKCRRIHPKYRHPGSSFLESGMNLCAASFSRVKTCARCRKVQYCSPGCQKAGWKMHKEICNKKRKTPEEEEEEDEEEDEDEEGEGSDYDE